MKQSHKKIIDKVSQKYGKDWQIKDHVLAGNNLWWQKAMEEALIIRDEELLLFLEEILNGEE